MDLRDCAFILLPFLASDYVMCVYIYNKEQCRACTGLRELVGSPSLEMVKPGLAKGLSNMDLPWGVGGQGSLEVPYSLNCFMNLISFQENKSMKILF